jgi:plastocyanin
VNAVMMIKETNGSSQLNLVIKSCISICIAALFALSMFLLSPINLALSIKTPEEDQHGNENKVDATITGPVILTISNIGNPQYQTSKTFAESTIPSSLPPSSSNNPTNLTTEKSAVSKTLSEKVLIGDEESEKPFNPSPVNITVGNTIVWINSDVETHTVISDSPDNNITKGQEFDSGNLNPNQSFEHTFNKGGTYNYFCIIHPSMTGVVNVR